MKKPDIFLPIIVFIVISTLIMDGTDAYYYNKYLGLNGISILSFVPLRVIYKYLTTYPGNILTLLGFVPWVILFGILYADDLKDKIIQKSNKKTDDYLL